MIRRILLGLGGSEFARSEIQYAVDLADRYGAEVTAVTVVAVDKIEMFHADSSSKYGIMGTGGSAGMTGGFVPMREVAAVARMMLVSAAAKQWGVDEGALRAENGRVVEASGARSARYGELVELARAVPVPKEPRLKPREQFRVLGTSARRVDNRAKVTGTAVFGLDITVPNMAKAAAVGRPPAISTKRTTASAVPPVAKTSSTSKIASPGEIASTCISSVSWPYSRA